MFLIKSKLGTYVVSEVRGCHTSYWFNKTKHLIEAIFDQNKKNIFKYLAAEWLLRQCTKYGHWKIFDCWMDHWMVFRGMADGWVSDAWPLGGFLRHGHWVSFWMATGWISEACPLDEFLRHGHSVGFYGMATRWVSEALPLNGFLRHDHWLNLCGMDTGWIYEAWLLDGFLRHGH